MNEADDVVVMLLQDGGHLVEEFDESADVWVEGSGGEEVLRKAQ